MDNLYKVWASPHLFNKDEKMKIIFYLNIRYHGNQTIRLSVILQKRAYSKQNISLKQRIKFISMDILCNQHLIFNTKIKLTNKLSQFMLKCQSKHHTISDFTKMLYSTKRAYSKQTISFQQFMNNFQHILHNPHLVYKYIK